MIYFLLVLVGVFGGIISSFIGIGGGIIIIPILVYIMHFDIKTSTAISMVNIFFSSIFSSIFYYYQKSIHIRYALYLGISSVAFSFLGSYFSQFFSDISLTSIYLLVLIASLTLLLLRGKFERKKDSRKDTELYKLIPVGIVAGFSAGLLGIGGGYLFVPALMFFCDLPIKLAVGTSLGAIFINSIAGLIGKVLFVKFDILKGVAVGLGAIIGSRIGTYLNKKSKTVVVKYVFIFIMSVTLIRVIIDIYNQIFN